MNWQKIIPFIIALFLTSKSFALFCPNNFNPIDLGDTIEQVEAQCGKPDTQTKREEEENVPQEWNYFVAQTVSMGSPQQATGTLKTSVAFDKDGKIVNISVNGIGVGATSICGQSLQLGDIQKSVKNACGTPSYVTKQTPVAGAEPPKVKKITEYLYKVTPPVKLIFTDGILTERQ